jgi:uncharacterized protein with HEPN domain
MPVNKIAGLGDMCDREIENYDGVTMEIQRIWDVRTNRIPVTIAASRTVLASLKKYLNNVPGKHNIKEI